MKNRHVTMVQSRNKGKTTFLWRRAFYTMSLSSFAISKRSFSAVCMFWVPLLEKVDTFLSNPYCITFLHFVFFFSFFFNISIWLKTGIYSDWCFMVCLSLFLSHLPFLYQALFFVHCSPFVDFRLSIFSFLFNE